MTKEQKQYSGEKIAFSTNGAGQTGHPHAKKESRICLTPLTKINSKWNSDLYVKCKTIKLLEDNMVESLDDLGLCNDFLDETPKHDPRKK